MDKELKRYFEEVIALEKNVYTQKATLAAMDQKIASLGYYRNIKHDEVTSYNFFFEEFLEQSVYPVLIGAGFFGVKGLFSGFISGAIGGILKGGLLGILVGFVIALVKYLYVRSQEKERQSQYDADFASAKAKDNQRVQEELRQKERLTELRGALAKQHEKTLELLRKYYAAGTIYPKYHTMNAVCSFYEYFLSGRCSSLTGHEGAYNIYESELRSNIIIAKLDDILANLEQIKSSQFMLYSAISEGNKKINQLVSESERQTSLLNYTAQQTAIAAYNAEETRNEVNQLKWLKVFELQQRNY